MSGPDGDAVDFHSDPGKDQDILGQLIGDAEEAADTEAKRTAVRERLLAGLRSGSWLDAQVFPPLRYAVPGLIPEGLSLLVGAPKIGKSWLSLSVAIAVASGGRVLGGIPVGGPRPVLLLALEDGDRRLQDRVRKLIPGDPIPRLLHYMTRVEYGMVVPTIEAWLETVEHPEPLVMLDTIGKMMPPAMNGETTYQRDYKVGGRLKEICFDRPGMSLAGLHHDRKAGAEDFVDLVSGTNGLAGAADTIILISRPRNGTQGLLKVTGRDIVEGEYAVTIEDGTWRLMGNTLDEAADTAVTLRATANLGDTQSEILRYVVEHPGGVTPSAAADALGIERGKVKTYLSRLYETGRILRPHRGVYTPVTSVTSVTSQGDTQSGGNTSNGSNTTSRGCDVCGNPLHPALVEAGETTHPNCDVSRATAMLASSPATKGTAP